jgi:hypothetical protein
MSCTSILVHQFERSGETYGLNLQDEVNIVSLLPGPDRSHPLVVARLLSSSFVQSLSLPV